MTSQDGTTTYAYDVRDRLTEACFTTGCSSFVRYAYDAVGNRLSETRPEGTTTYSYDAADQLSSRDGLGGSVSYSYDSRGNQTQAGSRSFAWTLANRLASTTDGGTTLNYAYDGDGTRLQSAGGGATANFLWDNNFAVPQLALERDAGGAVLRSYVHGQGPVAMQAGGQTSYFHPDALGSIANITSPNGATQWTYSYEPYGLARSATKNDPAAPDNPLRFAGEYLDTATSLYHLRARQLDPATGRFLGTDPLQRAAMVPAISNYAYADDQPAVFVDPLGLGPVWPDDDSDDCAAILSLECVVNFGGNAVAGGGGTGGGTLGGCLGFGLGFFVGTRFSLCLVTDGDSLASTLSGGVGLQSPAIWASATVQGSTAKSVNQLSGPFGYVGGGAGLYSGGIAAGACGGDVVAVGELGAGISIPGAEAHAGIDWTLVDPIIGDGGPKC